MGSALWCRPFFLLYQKVYVLQYIKVWTPEQTVRVTAFRPPDERGKGQRFSLLFIVKQGYDREQRLDNTRICET